MPDTKPNSVRRVSWPLLALSLAGVAGLTLLPIGWQLNRFVVWLYYRGLQLWRFPLLREISMEAFGGLLNVLLMVPIALTAAVALPRIRWWHLALAILVLSTSIELAQALLPLGRDGTVADVATNMLGGALGARVGAAVSRRFLHHPGHREAQSECPPPVE